jgi:hypothetical protein
MMIDEMIGRTRCMALRRFGLKGRFCQPRPEAWEGWPGNQSNLKGSFTCPIGG